MILGITNRFKTATLTASAETTSMPIENLQSDQLDLIWRVTSLPAYIDWDFGSSATFQAVVLRGNFTSAATIRIRASDTDTTTGDVLDTGTVSASVDDNYNDIWYYLSSEYTARYGRIDLADSGNSRFDIGGCYVGPILAPTYDVIPDWSVNPIDFSRKDNTAGGHVLSELRNRTHELDFVLNLTEAEGSSIAMALGRHGTAQNVLAMIDTSGSYVSERAALGPMERIGALRSPFVGTLKRARYTVHNRVKPV